MSQNDNNTNKYSTDSLSKSNTNTAKTRGHKKKILKLIKNSGSTGISMPKLCKEMELDRKTIYRLIEELNEEAKRNSGEIIVKRKNKGPYVLASQIAKENWTALSMVFGQDATKEILGNPLIPYLFANQSLPTSQIISLQEKEQSFFIDFYKNEKINLTDESKFLFDFALRIGKLIIFVMLKAVKPYKEQIDGKEKEKRSLIQVKHSINPISILFQFIGQDIIKNGKMNKRSAIKRSIQNMNSKISYNYKKELLDKSISDELFSHFEVNEKAYQSLENGFKEIWPYTFMVLEDMSQPQRLSRIVEEGIRSVPRTRKSIKKLKKKNLSKK